MSTTMSAVHAAIVSAVDGVTGMAQSPVSFRTDFIADGVSNGYFYVEPVGVEVGSRNGDVSIDEATFSVVFAWRLTLAPNDGAQAAMDKANAIRDALHAEPLSGARIDVRAVSYDYEPHHVIVSLETVARYTVSYA